ncbi:MAG: diguanylate cyclase [Candidatus Eisenbacteria bacterium]|nr:diguanylate cyclase [Candidatus Eisenbacteria bacterium]
MAVGERHRSRRDLENEIGALRQRLGESEEILRAIRAGEVDAILVADDAGERILTVEGADSAFRVLVEAMNEGAAILRECGTLTYCNGRLAAMLKSPLELVMGQPLIEFIASPDRPAWRALLDRHHAAGCTGTVALLCTDGSTLPVQLSLSAMQVHGHQSVCLVATDLTEHIRTEEELRSLSLVDALTGLYNRRGFFTLAEQQLKLARRIDGQLQLVFADLDDLKLINDRLGHDEGDRALMDVAAILRTTFRESDTIARLGGTSSPSSPPAASR